METWESIWGIWNEMTPHDSEAVRRIGKIERMFAAELISADWEPHTPVLQHNIYASMWPGRDRTLWTIVSKNEFDVSGQQIQIPYDSAKKYYDVWHGVELTPTVKNGAATLSFEIEGNGYGAVLSVTTASVDDKLKKFLSEMNQLGQARLDSFTKERRFLKQTLVDIASTKPAANAPSGMQKVPAATFDFEVSGIEIEGSNEVGVDVQYPWENSPRRNHKSVVPIKSFYMDRYPVTNAEFKKFLDASHYHPRDDHNFLKDWKNGSYPEGWAGKPVTWVSLVDARAYAAWAGKRLPHEWEWQYAAQGSDGRMYPWGNRPDPGAVPVPEKGRDLRSPDDVSAHPRGASPFAIEDLVGNVWQWTDEYRDEHTRAAILRGGSYYQPQGSHWYFPQAYRMNEHGKLLLMAPSKDRAGTLGFRCVVDTE
jgi:formylglycine-generating enzyme required for sulfatase activity